MASDAEQSSLLESLEKRLPTHTRQTMLKSFSTGSVQNGASLH